MASSSSSIAKNKGIVISTIVFCIAIVAYNYLLKSSQEAATSGISAENIGNDVLQLNQSLQAVTLDQSVFSSSEYKSLTNWAPALSVQPSGRNNPFAPIGQ